MSLLGPAKVLGGAEVALPQLLPSEIEACAHVPGKSSLGTVSRMLVIMEAFKLTIVSATINTTTHIRPMMK